MERLSLVVEISEEGALVDQVLLLDSESVEENQKTQTVGEESEEKSEEFSDQGKTSFSAGVELKVSENRLN